MKADAARSADPQRFHPSRDSVVARTRMWCAIAFLLLPLWQLVALRSISITTLAACAAALVLADWHLRRRTRADAPLVTVTARGIESPHFAGGARAFDWADVDDAVIRSVWGVRVLRLRLRADPRWPDRRRFWSSRNPARPHLALDVLSVPTQERLMAAVAARLPRRGEVHPLVAEIRRETQFAERLRALAPVPRMLLSVVVINAGILLATYAWGWPDGVSTQVLLALGGNAASEVQRGEWWRPVTAVFLHGSFSHFVMNTVGLLIGGVLLERLYGSGLFALIYLASGVLGSAVSLHFGAQEMVSVGGSGAVFGVSGALLAAVVKHRSRLPQAFGRQMRAGIAFFVFVSIAVGFTEPTVDNAAHLGGLLGGALLGLVLPVRLQPRRFVREVRWRAAAAAIAACAIAVAAAESAPRAQVDQRRVAEGTRHFVHAIDALHAASTSLSADEEALRLGWLSREELVLRSQTVHAPAFRKVQAAMDAAYVPQGDPRTATAGDLRRFAQLLADGLALEWTPDPVTGRLEPVDAPRHFAIRAEVDLIAARIAHPGHGKPVAR